MTNTIISSSEEIDYISSRINHISKKKITKIMNAYYILVDFTKNPNPEDHYNTIAIFLNINISIIIDIFTVQYYFLGSKNLIG